MQPRTAIPVKIKLTGILISDFYLAKTAMDETIAPYFYKEKNEKRMLIKQLCNTPADIIANEEEQTLIITVASLNAHF